MLFLLAKVFQGFAAPSQALLLFCVAGTLLCTLRRRRWGMRALYLSVGGFVLIAVLPIDRWLIEPLEDRFPQVIAPPAHVDGILVLGGAVDTDRTEDRGIPALNWAAERMTAFVGLARRYPEAKLVFTGGSGLLMPGSLSEADVARALFTELGVDQKRMIYEDASRTTFENAELSRRLVHPKPDEVWILVTSANHMPRSVGVFRRLGWKMLPWPVAFKAPAGRDVAVLHPFVSHLAIVDLAVHEWVGLLVYYLTGRTDALFPGP
jgi:uncharacterized SAM-binding protein YcdF (DUF218 family)